MNFSQVIDYAILLNFGVEGLAFANLLAYLSYGQKRQPNWLNSDRVNSADKIPKRQMVLWE